VSVESKYVNAYKYAVNTDEQMGLRMTYIYIYIYIYENFQLGVQTVVKIDNFC